MYICISIYMLLFEVSYYWQPKVRAQYRGWTAEMYSWLLAARLVGIRFGYLAEVVSPVESHASLHITSLLYRCIRAEGWTPC